MYNTFFVLNVSLLNLTKKLKQSDGDMTHGDIKQGDIKQGVYRKTGQSNCVDCFVLWSTPCIK